MNGQCMLLTRYEMAYLGVLAPKVAAQPLLRFVLIDAGPFRIKGERVRRCIYVVVAHETKQESGEEGREGARDLRQRWSMHG